MFIQSIPSILFSVPGIGLKFLHSAIIAPITPVCVSFGIASRRICDVRTGIPRRRTLLACTGNPPSLGIASIIAFTFAPACIAW